MSEQDISTTEKQTTGEEVAEAAEEVAESVEKTAEEATENVEEAVEEVAEATEEATENVEEAVEEVAEATEEATENVEETAEEATEAVEETAEEAVEAVEATASASEPAEAPTEQGEIKVVRGSGPPEYVPNERMPRSRRITIDVNIKEISYKNIPLLTRFLDRHGRILSRRKTRVSAKAQRRVVNSVKRARHLALLPYTGEHTRIVRKRR